MPATSRAGGGSRTLHRDRRGRRGPPRPLGAWEADDHVTSDQFRTDLADALMKFCRGLFATTNLIYLSRPIPLLREERLIVLLSGGEALVAASAVRPEVAG